MKLLIKHNNINMSKQQLDTLWSRLQYLDQQITKSKAEDKSITEKDLIIDKQIYTSNCEISMMNSKKYELGNALAIEQKKGNQLDDQITKELSFNEAITKLLGQYEEYNPISQNGFDPQLMGGLTLEEQDEQLATLINQSIN